MKRSNPLVTSLLAALLAGPATTLAAPSEAAAVSADWILARLARPAPMRTSFVELRGSRLLKAPLRIEGEYQRPRADMLVREVRAPYAETTTIVDGKAGAGEVTITRGGKSRRFALSRAPELVGLQASFGALLAGDRKLLEQHYRIATQGTRQQWTLVLVPKDKTLAAKVRDITLRGRGAELRCIDTQSLATRQAPADVQRTRLAGAARAADGISDPGQLAALCHSR
jgi:hypothetical protein